MFLGFNGVSAVFHWKTYGYAGNTESRGAFYLRYLLPLRKDKAKIKKLVEEDPLYQRLDEETARTAGVLMGIKFMEQKDKYKNQGGYNMCQAIREMMEDSRSEGWEEGKTAGIRILIQSSRDDGTEDSVIADKLQKYYGLSSDETKNALSLPFFQTQCGPRTGVSEGEKLTEAVCGLLPVETFIRAEVTDAEGRKAWSNLIDLRQQTDSRQISAPCLSPGAASADRSSPAPRLRLRHTDCL